MIIGGATVESKESYEQLYIKSKKNSKIYYFWAIIPDCLALLGLWVIELIDILNVIINSTRLFVFDNTWSLPALSLGFSVRLAIISTFIDFMWHKNLAEEYRKTSKGKQAPSILRPWLAVIQTILCILLLLSGLDGILQCIYYIIFAVHYDTEIFVILYYVTLLICCFVATVGYSGLFHYLIKYFRYFRWTWEELQLPAKVRKEQYRTQRREARQKRREARKAKWQAFRSTHFAGGESKQQKPAAKTVKTQADRRAELENLKKLYEDGLIDEEEYRRAREKTLDI